MYFDDILVYSIDMVTHLEHLRIFMEGLREINFTLIYKSVVFLQSNVELSCFIVGVDTI